VIEGHPVWGRLWLRLALLLIIGEMGLERTSPDASRFNRSLALPFNLRIEDFQIAMQDVYDFFFDVNDLLVGKGLGRLDDMLRPANMSGLLSDMLTASIARHSRSLTVNEFFNGHPDLIVKGVYPNNSIKAGKEGVEIKTTRKRGGAVDTHGARDQWFCVWVYEIDDKTEPATARRPMVFTEAYLAQVTVKDFRKNARGELGTRTATLDKAGLAKFRRGWLYRLRDDGP
jgi:hypothetical protein